MFTFSFILPYLKKAAKWVQENIILVLLLLCLYLLYQNYSARIEALSKTITINNKSYQTQISTIQKSNIEERENRKKITKKYELQLENLEIYYQKEIKGLNTKMIDYFKKLMEDPKQLDNELRDLGIIVE